PYSVSSANKGEHIERLMERYKAAVRSEQNIQPLSNDYVKFIRFAHDRIERTGYGVVGMITDYSYLYSLIHRGMREELMKSFDEIYVLNLHGSALMGETPPDGSLDKNVFDITRGVAIALFVKRQESEGLAQVKYADLWGLRDGKYCYLLENDISTTKWQILDPVSPYFFFVPKDFDLLSEYERGWSISDIFPVNASGIITHRDHFVLDFDPERLRSRIAAFRDEALSDDEVRERFKLNDTRDWKLPEARAQLQAREDWEEDFNLCFYRPFDVRSIYYSGDVVEFPRSEVMQHLLKNNLAMVTTRVYRGDRFTSILVSRYLVEKKTGESTRGTYCFPLYLYDKKKKEKRLKGGGSVINLTLFESGPGYTIPQPNLAPAFVAAVKENLGLDFVQEGKGDIGQAQGTAPTTFGPEDVFCYIYAILHSPTYRERYAEFLKIDFPRIPLTSDREQFKALAEKGQELVALHLMESPVLNQLITGFPVAGSDKVEKVRYVEKVEEEKPPTPAADKAPGPLRAVMYTLPSIYGNEAPVEVKPEP
ncbi:MAG: hypothetical protein KAW49_14525, partial [Anaerolineae bacterium]|nr:hypothetical protein [Anaerolineae bacterium]